MLKFISSVPIDRLIEGKTTNPKYFLMFKNSCKKGSPRKRLIAFTVTLHPKSKLLRDD